jgi:hypothetical protein
MMCFEVLNCCSITFIEDGRNKGMVLDVGDIFFIDTECVWTHDTSNPYNPTWSKKSILKKIYYNRVFGFDGNDFQKEWTWINNINIVDPKISLLLYTFSGDDLVSGRCNKYFRNITTEWNRDKKIEDLLI